MRALAFKSNKALWLAAGAAALTVLTGSLTALLDALHYWHFLTVLAAAVTAALVVSFALKPRVVISVDGENLIVTTKRKGKTEIPLSSVDSVLYATAFRYDGYVIIDTPSVAYKFFVKDAAKACADIREVADVYLKVREGINK